MEKVKSINEYVSAFDVIEEYCDCVSLCDGESYIIMDEQISDEDDICFLQHFDDYEAYTYYVINGETVIVTIDSDVSAQFDSMEKFWEAVHALLDEDRENR